MFNIALRARGAGLAGPLGILALALGACGVEPVDPGGRPCSATQPCGPGTTCDPTTSRCVVKTTPPDGSADKAPKPDKLPPPDTVSPDSFKAPDGGCPKGFIRCGNVCADIKTDPKHCGQCSNACSGKVANKCDDGKCVCGTGSGPCTGKLNCVAGTCKCYKGGLCKGCCKNNTCYPLGSGQSLTRCGGGGEGCRICKTAICKTTKCTTGACVHTSLTGPTCSDGVACTNNDKCVAGTCGGTKYSCDDNAGCTSDACTGNKSPYHCKYTVKSGYCAIKTNKVTVCYVNGTKHAKDACLTCSSSKSSTTWTKISGCSSSANVTTVVTGLNKPRGVVVTSSGVVYIADTYNHLIRKWDGTKLSTLAGSAQGFKDGTGSAAAFYRPVGLALGSKGVTLYVADQANHSIRKVTTSGVVTTVAGTGFAGLVNGSTTTAKFTSPTGVAVDLAGKLYVTDMNNHVVRLISGATVSTFAGSTYGLADDYYLSAKFAYPSRIVLSKTSGAFYVADTNNFRIRRLYKGKVTTFAGSKSGYLDGSATAARFGFVRGLALGSTGKLYVTDSSNNLIRVVSGGKVSTLAGGVVQGYKDGSASVARFRFPYDLALHSSGKIYVADSDNNVLRLITISGTP